VQDNGTGAGYSSADGQTWSLLAAGALWGSPGAIDAFYSPNFNMWYLVNVDSDNDQDYALWSTPDPSLYPFQKTILDGSRQTTSGYLTAFYWPKYDTFVIGTSDAGGIALSTARPTTIKSVGDDIRVRGMPVSCGKYSTYSTTSVTQSGGTVTLSSASNKVGSLSFQATTPLGMVIEFDMNLLVTATNNNLTITYKDGNSTLFSHSTGTFTGSNVPINIRSRITVTATTACQVNSMMCVDNASPRLVTGTPSWSISPHDLSITGSWANGNSATCTMNQLVCTTQFPNGH
jgi:hypothetical protein